MYNNRNKLNECSKKKNGRGRGKNHELEHRTIENAQSTQQKEKNILEKNNRNYRTCGTTRMT